VGASEFADGHVREQVKPAEAVVATRREPTHQEIYNKIREVVGLAGPEEFRSDQVKNNQAYHIRERELPGVPAGARPSLGRGQRRKKEQKQKRLDRERVNECTQ
jgi:hypothetical protein